MSNSSYIRKLLQEISKIITDKREIKSTYGVLTDIVISMEKKYNLQEEEIINQLELILKAIK